MVWSYLFTYVNVCVLNLDAFMPKSSPNILVKSADFIALNQQSEYEGESFAVRQKAQYLQKFQCLLQLFVNGTFRNLQLVAICIKNFLTDFLKQESSAFCRQKNRKLAIADQ